MRNTFLALILKSEIIQTKQLLHICYKFNLDQLIMQGLVQLILLRNEIVLLIKNFSVRTCVTNLQKVLKKKIVFFKINDSFF
jgi:hypothetical protein